MRFPALKRCWGRLSILALALGLLLALPALASASTYAVNSLGAGSNIAACEDGDACTLRDAIEKANFNEGHDTIEFEVAGTIALGTQPLPAITDSVTIDGTSAPGYAGTPKIAIDGKKTSSGTATEGLSLLGGSDGSLIEGVAIGNFEIGIQLTGESQVCASYLGVALDGTTAFPNNVGIETGGSGDRVGAECAASGNVISGNTSYGIIDFGEGTEISRNKIGVDATGAPQKNGRPTSVGAGILVTQFASDPSIRGIAGLPGEIGNVIADNEGAGILVESGSSRASIRQNSIHGNSRAAIEIQGPPQTPAPELEFSSVELGTSTVLGNLEAAASEAYEIDVFASPTCYPSHAGEAQVYIGTIFMSTNASGDGTFFSEELAEPPAGYEYFTATATPEETQSTSVVSLCQDQRPGVAVGTVPNGFSSSTEGTFEFIGLDANGKVAGFECRLDGGSFESCNSPQTYTDLADGAHTFELRAFDQVGTVQPEPFTYTWTVDTEFPIESFESTPPNSSNKASPTFEFNVSDGDVGSGVAKVECQVDEGGLEPCSSPDTIGPLADGPHRFEVRATDVVGHTSFDFYEWTVDTAPPIPAIESKPPNPSKSAAASFTFSAADGDGSGVEALECSLDGAAFGPCTSPQSLTGLSDGSHSFEVRAVDKAGNASEPVGYDWTVDATAPQIALGGRSSDPTNATFGIVEFEATDPGGTGIAKTECRFDGAVLNACSSPATITPVADGLHEFEVKATDKAGNSAIKTYTWTVDSTAPTATIESKPSNPSKSAAASFSFSGADGGGTGVETLECRLDGGGFNPCTSPQSFSGLEDGSHSFEVRAIDKVGNVGDPASYTWTVDTGAPQIALGGRSSDPTNSTLGTVEFEATDPGGTGIAKTECRFDAAQLAPCTSPATKSSLADGSHTFEVKATDNAGNSATKTYTWTVDATAPTATIESKPPNPSKSAAASFTFSAADGDGSGVEALECSLDGAPFGACTSPRNLTGLADGSHTFEVRAIDKVGNAGSAASYTWAVDTGAPQVVLGSKPADPTNQTAATVEFEATDPGGTGIAKTECRFDGAQLASCSSPDTSGALADGSHLFEVKATDGAGNSTSKTYTWTVDATPPTTSIGTKPSDPSNSATPSFTFSASDAGGTGIAGFECRLDAQPFSACTSAKTYTGVADGIHTFEVRSFDKAGNADPEPASYTWQVESAVPVTPQLTKTNPASPAPDPAPLLFGTAPAGTTVRVYANPNCTGALLTTATPGELAAGLEVSAAPNSVTQYSANATSQAAITSACSAPLSYREDSTAPTTTIDSKPSDPSASGGAKFTFSADDPGGSGIAGFECRLDDSGFAPCTSPVSYNGLGDGSHLFEVRAFDAAGNVDTTSASYTWRVDTSSEQRIAAGGPGESGPTPTNGDSVAVAPEGGKVFVQRPGQKKPTELKEGQTIPVGSLVDATDGKVLLTSVNANGETQSAYFYGGKFLVTQHDGSGLVVLKLRGELDCAGTARSSSATASAKSGRRLWGSGHGNFRTEGNSGSATVRGTIWLTEDRCNGSTFFRVRRGIVSVRDFTKGKTISLPAGNTYTAGP